METKPALKSKTLWINLLMAVCAFIPSVHVWVQSHPEAIIALFTVVNIILRFVTKGKIELL